MGAETAGAETRGPETAPLPRRPSLGNVAAYSKYQSAKHLNALRQIPAAPVWQRNYYEHIVRNEKSLNRIRQYILSNPARWAFDPENPRATAGEPADRVELLVAREDQEAPAGLSPFLVLLLDLVDELTREVEHAVRAQVSSQR